MKKIFVIIILTGICFSGSSQNTFFKELHQFVYVGNVVETPDSGFLIPGTTVINNQWVTGLMKLNSTGDSVWMKYYDFCCSGTNAPVIAVNNEGDIFMASSRLRKLNSTGDSLWGMDLAPNGWNEVILPMPDGGVIAAGYLTTYWMSPAIIRADRNGNQIFKREFYNFQDLCTLRATGICTLNNENILVVYHAIPCVTYGYSYFTYGIEITSAGDSVRNFLFNKYESQIMRSVLKTENGLIFSGGRNITPYSQNQSYMIKSSLDYSILWDTSYYFSDTLEWITSSCFSEDPEIIYHVGTNYQDNIVLLEANASDGIKRWKREYYFGYEASPVSVIATRDGGIAFSGYARSMNEHHGLIIKVNNKGNFNGIGEINRVPEFKIGPNPVHGTTHLKWLSVGDYTLTISNSAGTVLKTVTSKSTPGESISLSVDMTGYAGGIYFCRLESGGSETVRKMLVY